MNRTFKVVFNKARGSMMVANEATSNVQKKGTKLLVATAVASVLSCSSAFAVDYSSETDNAGYAEATANQELVFEGTEVLNISATGADTQVYGLLATGENSFYTNEGKINLNLASGENAAKFWKTKGMMADNNGTAVNEGTINVTNAYGMTVGSSGETNTITNAKEGTINVDGQGAAMEVAPTGVSGTTGTAKGVANNNGTINVNSKDAYGTIVAGQNGEINQNGTLNAADGAAAILVQAESGKTTSGNIVTLAQGSKTSGNILIQGVAAQKEPEVPKNFVKDTTLLIEDGAEFDGSIVVTNAEGTKIRATADFDGQTAGNGAAIFFNDANGTLDLSGSNFTNNTAGTTTGAGGAVYSYAQTFTQKGGSYVGNKAVSEGYNGTEKDPSLIQDGAIGGAMVIKGNNPISLEDVLFENNSAIATKTENTVGGSAYGGAILVDYSTGDGDGTGENRAADLIVKITKDMAYTGNTVSSDSTGTTFDTYGYHVHTAAAGGFLFLDRGSKAAFDIANGATLTIGAEGTTGDTDSIASSIPNEGTDKNGGQHASIEKVGNGQLVINSSLDKYYGTVAVNDGVMAVNSAWDIKNKVAVGANGTLVLNNFTLASAETSGNQDVDGTKIGGSLEVSGTLQTQSGMVFTQVAGEEVSDVGELTGKVTSATFTTGGALALSDEVYTLAYANSASEALGKMKLIMLGQVAGVENNTVTFDQIESIAGETVLDSVTVDSGNKDIQIGGSDPSSETIAYRDESLSVGAIDLGSANQVTVTGEGTFLNLTGNGDDIVASTSTEEVSVKVQNGATLALGGHTQAQGGTLNAEVELAEGTQMIVSGAENFTVSAVVGAGTVEVGNDGAAGKLSIGSIDGFTGMIFVDPDWVDGVGIEGASQVAVEYSDPVQAEIVAARNSIISVGSTTDEAVGAFNKIAQVNGLNWGEGQVEAAVYIGKPIDITSGDTQGGIQIDGSLTDESEASVTRGQVTVGTNGMLIANQSAVSGEEALVTGTVTFATNSYLGLSNAVEGEFKLADAVQGFEGAQVVTDNPFITGSLNGNGTVTTKTDVDSGLMSIESLGLQAMTRRADSVLAATIADRTSFGQQLKPGLNLWVDVAGENYQADDFDKGGEFEADMGYGTFGADVAVGNFTVGGALQYGTGTLRSSVNGIKNSIDNYGVSLYGTYSVTDNFKLGAELAYVWGENDITADQAALNQSVDTEMYSAGVRAMYEMKAGNFRFVPSIGLRVSQLSTDEMKVGAVKIEDQDQTLVQLPIAMRITAADYSTASGWTLSPSFKLAYVPTFGDKDIEVLNTAEDVIDTSPVQADFGLMAGKDNMLFNVNFMLGAGEYGSSAVGGKVGFKYAF